MIWNGNVGFRQGSGKLYGLRVCASPASARAAERRATADASDQQSWRDGPSGPFQTVFANPGFTSFNVALLRGVGRIRDLRLSGSSRDSLREQEHTASCSQPADEDGLPAPLCLPEGFLPILQSQDLATRAPPRGGHPSKVWKLVCTLICPQRPCILVRSSHPPPRSGDRKPSVRPRNKGSLSLTRPFSSWAPHALGPLTEATGF